jgi:hypothetical protein
MKCERTDIRELLTERPDDPQARELSPEIELHLVTCAECRADAELLRMLQTEPVPDPGPAFWDALPNRIHRAVRAEQQAGKRKFPLAYLLGLLRSPLVAAAVAASLVLVTASVVIMTTGNKPVISRVEGVPGTIITADADEAMPLSEMDQTDLDAVRTWTGAQYTAMGREFFAPAALVSETDLNEELADLQGSEIDRFAGIIDRYGQEES